MKYVLEIKQKGKTKVKKLFFKSEDIARMRGAYPEKMLESRDVFKVVVPGETEGTMEIKSIDRRDILRIMPWSKYLEMNKGRERGVINEITNY